MSKDPVEKTSTHHLMRVRVKTRVFSRLQEIAKEEAARTGDTTSVSDLVRYALSDFISVYESQARLTAIGME